MTPQELKSSILQLAVQGKLTDQRVEDGTAEELYLKIQEEKQSLIKEGKIKKEKPLPEITEDEIPFDIPDSWKWARITDCGSFISGYTPKPNQLVDHGEIPYFKVADMNTKGNELFMSITSCYLSNKAPQKFFLKNTIVYPKNGGAVFTNKKRILSQDSVVDLNTGGYSVIGSVYLMYYYYFFSLIDFRQCYKGTALPTIDMEKLKKKWIPLPPLAEQKRIVAKIEELLPYIDRYEKAWSKLEDFNKRFPGDMQKSVLQMAIQGKLVEQRPEEGTGEELYRQIQAEKQRLIKSGKIKKEKPLPEISEDEIPFDIPESWKWVRLEKISLMIGDIDHKMPETIASGGIPYISPINFTENDEIDYDSAKMVSLEDYKKLSQKCSPALHDIIFPRYGTIGVVRIVKTNRPFLVSYSCCTIKNLNNSLIDYMYIFFVLKSELTKNEIRRYINKTTQPNVGLKSIKQFLFPLPPLAEQKRIVQKLEEILPLCEKLK